MPESDDTNTASEALGLREDQQEMFSGKSEGAVAEDVVGRRIVQLRSYKSLERLRDRVLLTSRELARLRAENAELHKVVEELKATGGKLSDGTAVVFTESPAVLRSKVESFIEAIDQYLEDDLADEIRGSEVAD